MIESHLYLIVSHLDISFSVEACVMHQANPKESHLISIKRVIHYISGTLDYGLWYPYDWSLIMVGYSDANWAKNVENRKSAYGACFFIGDFILA